VVQKWIQKQVQSHVTDSPNLPCDTESRSPWLLGCCSCHLRKSCAGADMVHLRAECVFIFKHYFVSELFAAVREAFSFVYPDKAVPNKTTVHWLVTKFRDTGSICLWKVLIKRQNSWNNIHTNFNQCISCSNGIWLQEFSFGRWFCCFVREWFVCSS
jgi:hypothetical protein